MPALVWILLILGVALTAVVMLAQRFGRPLSAAEQSRLGRILMVLVFVLLLARLIAEWW